MRWREYFVMAMVVMAAPRCGLAQSGGTLEVPARIIKASPVEPTEQLDTGGERATTPIHDSAPPNDAAQPTADLPYLGASVQYIESNDTPGAAVHGLQVVSVDPNSPAEQAGLRGQGQLTKIGASGVTAGAMMAPLDLIIVPLLKKAGKLGADGDLIVAIDDNRVEGASALETALETLKPGDTIYLTIIRLHQDGQHETLKLPIKLGPPHDLASHADPFAYAH
jgi:C-terminal processing protease CtpA/Prc